MKVHLESENKSLTVCGGRISGTKSTGRKQFFAWDLEMWEKHSAVKDRCVKCQAAYEAMKRLVKEIELINRKIANQ